MWSKSKIKNKKNWTLLIIITSIILLSASINLAQAQEIIEFQPQIPIPGVNTQSSIAIDKTTGELTSNLLSSYITAIYDYGLSIAGILAAIILMAGGIIWLTSAGNETKVGQAKSMIISSITGLVILFSAWIILNTVNPKLLDMQVLTVPIVKELNYCSPVKGPTADAETFACSETASSTPQKIITPKCTAEEECTKTTLTCYDSDPKVMKQVNRWACMDSAQWICCEYDYNFFNARACKTFSLSAVNGACPPTYQAGTQSAMPLKTFWKGKICNLPKGADNSTPCYTP